MTEREHVTGDQLTGDHSLSELCRRYRISRTSGYEWGDRDMVRCELADRSRTARVRGGRRLPR